MDVGDTLQRRRKELGLTLREVAEKVGVSEGTVSRWESGDITNMRRDKIKAISDVLRVSPLLILGLQDSVPLPHATKFPEILEIGKSTFPLFSGIACGEPIYMEETIQCYVSVTTNIRADFVLRAVGDSMSPGIRAGDLVFIRSQPMVNNGEVAAVAIGESATLKRVYWYQQSKTLVLRPDNPEYQEMVYDETTLETVRILGKAVAYQRDVR